MASMLSRLVVHTLIVAAALWVAESVVPGVKVHGGLLTLLWVAFLFGVVNAFLGTVLRLVSLPLTVLTFGLFALVVNGLLLAATAGLSSHFDVGGFGWTVVAAAVVSVVSAAIGFVLAPIRS
jgi:putative membrane protein